MKSQFEPAVSYVLSREGGLSENPHDAGGITNYGISLRFLQSIPDPRKYGIIPDDICADTIKELTIDQAKAIYFNEFWLHSQFEQLTNQSLCNTVFDAAVNMGIGPAIKCVQRACWAYYQDRSILVDDGILGSKTLERANQLGAYLLPVIRSERAGYYRLIAESSEGGVKFINGWLNRAYNQ